MMIQSILFFYKFCFWGFFSFFLQKGIEGGDKWYANLFKRGTNKENVWEHGNIGQFWKGTRTPPGRHSKAQRNFYRNL